MGNREPWVGVFLQPPASYPSRTPPGTRPCLHPRFPALCATSNISAGFVCLPLSSPPPPCHSLPSSSFSSFPSLVLCRTPVVSLLFSLFTAHLSEVYPAVLLQRRRAPGRP